MATGPVHAAAPSAAHASIETQLDRLSDLTRTDPARASNELSELRLDILALPPSETQARQLAKSERLKASALVQMNDFSAAVPLLAAARGRLSGLTGVSAEMGETLLVSAFVEYRTGDFEPALKDALEAFDLLSDPGSRRSRAKTLQLLGGLYRDAGDYERTLRYYQDAMLLAGDDDLIRFANLNNVGFAYEEMGRPDEALKAYEEASLYADRIGSALLQTRVRTNIAQAYVSEQDWQKASQAIARALETIDDPDARAWQPYVTGTQAQIAAGLQDPSRAQALFRELFEGRNLAETPAQFRSFHRTAAELYRQTGQDRLAYDHLLALKRLDDEAAQLSASANNALLAAQFDFAGQEVEIANLRNEQLESQVERERERAVVSRNTTLGVLVGAALIISLILYALYNVRKRRVEVSRINETLEDTNADLKKALNAKSEFLATTSHEIRTPLNGVLGMTQIMLADRDLAPHIRERVELVHGAGSTMKAIVDDILDVAKMETGAVALRNEPFDLRATLAEVGRIFEDTAMGKGLDWQIDLDRCPLRAIGDEQRVRQIVLNLISNAVKFTNEGHVRLSAEPDEKNPDGLRISVTDTGIGIPEDQQASVFAPFHQVDGTRTRAFSGTGLGLTICRELVDAMQGHLALTSKEGEGTRFNVWLPLSLTAANPADLNPLAGAAAGAQGGPAETTILYAPNTLVEMIATRALGKLSGPLIVEHDFDAALKAAAAAPIFLIAFGTTGTSAQVAALSQLRRDMPDLFIAAAGWPADAPQAAADICDADVADVPAMGKLASILQDRASGAIQVPVSVNSS